MPQGGVPRRHCSVVSRFFLLGLPFFCPGKMNVDATIDTKMKDELRVPIPLHAAPSAPWPWMDLKRDAAEVPLGVSSATSTLVEGEGASGDEGREAERAWCRYPQSLFENWTPAQVRRCRMFEVMGSGEGRVGECGSGSEREGQGKGVSECMVYRVDVFRGGAFRGGEGEGEREDGSGSVEEVGDGNAQEAFWTCLGAPRDTDIRLRALFVERMSGPVLQILGTRYNVEPFFFSSSANWIPSRYQEDAHPGKGDREWSRLLHLSMRVTDAGTDITVVLPFVRVVKNEFFGCTTTSLWYVPCGSDVVRSFHVPTHAHSISCYRDNTILLQDLLALHMVRTTTSDTILSYHPESVLRRGSATRLRSLLRRTGESVYWSKLYKKCKDPTIVLLALLWHATYAWDEALEVLYDYLNKTLEARELSTEHGTHTHELHKVRAHLIYYQQLLRDFRATVAFVRKTTNPAMDTASVTERERKTAAKILRSEADNLLGEVERLEKQREIQTNRVVNAMSLAFSTVKNEDMRAMHGLTTATVRDAATIKQISYFTLVFLPSYFMAGIFRMNVKEVNPNATETLAHYIEGTVIFTLCTAWLVIAAHDVSSFHPGGRNVVRRVAWPVVYSVGDGSAGVVERGREVVG
ncbi:hypothetical protein J3R83DRAFT_10770 [Lanmaoa asiatica]|nr:hypothetical protein J3R83DRAFT_10770 [Lanmaoa asiatica]